MNKPQEIKEAVKIIEEYFQTTRYTIMEEGFYKYNLLDKVSMDVLLHLGMKLVKNPAKTFLEYPDKEITDSKVEAVILLYGEKE